MVKNEDVHLKLTEREADLFYATIEIVLDSFVKPDFKTFDSLVYMDYMYHEDNWSDVIGFAGESDGHEYQIDLCFEDEGYLAVLWKDNFLVADIVINKKGEVTEVVKI